MPAKKELKIDGRPVKDAKKEIHVTISPRDVKAGSLKNATMCAAAQALVRTGVCEQARVHVNRTYIKKGDKWLRFKTPPALQKEIVAFDRGGSFEPGEYKLLPLPPSDNTAARKKRAFIAPKHPPIKGRVVKKRKPHITTGVRQRFNVGGRIA